eukprot:gnl/TRDRNA2_/TRDRNA2_81989_c0_seq1.p1 gnl/TRDRNA2_/TRDRNA2_81989_c0~~gnl/TRDRNA2_/TRDRNA2_81989_c0_seq1.p1  ORF type:complete len:572 (+),score=106.86 gnl/TRDRNA2_/TRDRNA2_81989_c0_seq1:105-1820(+)
MPEQSDAEHNKPSPGTHAELTVDDNEVQIPAASGDTGVMSTQGSDDMRSTLSTTCSDNMSEEMGASQVDTGPPTTCSNASHVPGAGRARLSRVRSSVLEARERDRRIQQGHVAGPRADVRRGSTLLARRATTEAVTDTKSTGARSAGGSQASSKSVTHAPSQNPALQCRDLKGCWHDTKELRERRNAAVMKGMNWMHKFLTANKHEALIEVGDDAACIFFEIWYTSSSSTIRGAAKGIAQDLLEKYERHLLQPASCKCKACHTGKRKDVEGKDLFMQLMYLVRCKEEMELDTQQMIERADSLWKSCGLADTNVLFGVECEDLDGVSDGDFVVLIMNIMVMEFNQLLFRKRWPLRWGLPQVFQHLRTRLYKGPPYDDQYKFHDAFYFATHIVFAISAYSAIKTNAKDVPWLFDYNKRSCLYWTKQAWRRLSGKQPNRLVDIDGLAESVDVMRGCGLTDGGDPLLCSATLALLALQKRDGSWPYWMLDKGAGDLVACEPEGATFYNLIHPSWVAVQSLRDRNFEYDRKGNQQWAKFMEKTLRESNLKKLETKIAYEWPSKRKTSVKAQCSAAE